MDFTLWQLPEQGLSQIMSYIIKTEDNKIIVIDGGTHSETQYLRNFLEFLGNNVYMWIITHPHPDHVEALTDILLKPEGITVKQILSSIPDIEWLYKNEPEYSECYDLYNRATNNLDIIDINSGEVFNLATMSITVLGIRNYDIVKNAVNNSSVAFKVESDHKSVLFLGDLGTQGGIKLLNNHKGNMLRADYVQMAHHGQNGVTREVYERIQPKVCLWPTPKWLYDNNAGKGYNTGPWKTVEVRKWAEELGVVKNIVSCEGLAAIRTTKDRSI